MVAVVVVPLLDQVVEVEDLALLELEVFVHPLVVELVMVVIRFLTEVVEEA